MVKKRGIISREENRMKQRREKMVVRETEIWGRKKNLSWNRHPRLTTASCPFVILKGVKMGYFIFTLIWFFSALVVGMLIGWTLRNLNK